MIFVPHEPPRRFPAFVICSVILDLNQASAFSCIADRTYGPIVCRLPALFKLRFLHVCQLLRIVGHVTLNPFICRSVPRFKTVFFALIRQAFTAQAVTDLAVKTCGYDRRPTARLIKNAVKFIGKLCKGRSRSVLPQPGYLLRRELTHP